MQSPRHRLKVSFANSPKEDIDENTKQSPSVLYKEERGQRPYTNTDGRQAILEVVLF